MKCCTVARVDRLITEREAKDPRHVARTQRIKASAGDARRALRTRRPPTARDRPPKRAGAAIRWLMAEGLSISDAAILLDITAGSAKRPTCGKTRAAVAHVQTVCPPANVMGRICSPFRVR